MIRRAVDDRLRAGIYPGEEQSEQPHSEVFHLPTCHTSGSSKRLLKVHQEKSRADDKQGVNRDARRTKMSSGAGLLANQIQVEKPTSNQAGKRQRKNGGQPPAH